MYVFFMIYSPISIPISGSSAELENWLIFFMALKIKSGIVQNKKVVPYWISQLSVKYYYFGDIGCDLCMFKKYMSELQVYKNSLEIQINTLDWVVL